MCKEWPGPRCAGHTKKLYDEKSEQVQNIKRILAVAEDDLASTFDNAYASAAETAAKQAEVLKLAQSITDTESERQIAKEIWASTPGGNSELSAQYTRALNSENREHAEALLHTINAGNEIREYRFTAQRIAAEAYKNAMETPDEVKENINSQNDRLTEVKNELHSAHKGISSLKAKVVQEEKKQVASHAQAQRASKNVRTAQHRARDIIIGAYIQAGVSEGLAEHYASDSVTETQEGWHYISSEPGNKFPKYSREIEAKLKPSSPETYQAAQALADNQKFHKAQEKLRTEVDNYEGSVQALKDQNDSMLNAGNELHSSLKAVEPQSAESTALQESILEAKALASSDLPADGTFKVDFANFTKSSYKNPDGSSNAYVRVNNVGGGIPSYVQVDKVVRTRENPHVVLKNGVQVPVKELRSSSIKLVHPGKGAQKLIN